MNNLTIVNQNGKLLVESRQVADMVNVRHADLIEKIKGYVNHLTNGEFRSLDFFIESTYEDTKGEIRPCYLITKKGCDMVANKMTGEKGVLFTATYVTRFDEMEKQLTQPLPQMSQLEMLAEIAKSAVEHEKQLNKISAMQTKQAEELQGIRNVVSLCTTNWREDAKRLITAMADKLGGFEHIQTIRKETYKRLNSRIGVDIDRRLKNKRQRMADEGICKSKRDKVNYLDVIAEDKKLLETYLAIIKEMAIASGVA